MKIKKAFHGQTSLLNLKILLSLKINLKVIKNMGFVA
jgi:hypothetical protein